MIRLNEYRDSINLGRIEMSRNDLILTDGRYRFSIEDYKEIKDHIEDGWRFPTEEEFKYIHSTYKDLEIFKIGRNSDYWIYGKSKPHPINNSPYWELYPCAMIFGDNIEFEYSSSGQNLRIRLIKDL